MSETVNQLIDNGYINNQEKNYVVLSKVLLNGEREEQNYALVDLIHDVVWEKIDGEVEVYYYQGTEEVYVEARTRGLTPGVALFLDELGSQKKVVIVEDQVEDITVEPTPKKVNVVRELAKIDEKKENVVNQLQIIEGKVVAIASSTEDFKTMDGILYYLQQDNGNYFKLDFSKMSETQKKEIISHRRVKITGRTQSDDETITVESFQYRPVASAPSSSVSTFDKNRKVGVFVVNFSGALNPQRNNIQGVRNFFFSGSESVAGWLKKMSHDQLTFSGDVIGPITLSDFSKGSNWNNDKYKYRDAITAQGYNLSKYHHVVIFVPNRTYGGIGEVGCIPGPCFTWLGYPHLNVTGRYIITHEIGHNLGNYHASWGSNEYGDGSCIMGDMKKTSGSPAYNPLLNAPHFHNIGLFDNNSNAVQSITSSGTYTISAMSTSLSDVNPKLLVIPKSGGGYIAVSYRQNSGKDAGISSLYTSGASIHTAPSKNGFLQIHWTNTYLQKILSDGVTYDAGSGIKITQLSKNSSNVTVKIDTGTTAVSGHKLTINSVGANGVSITTTPTEFNGTTNYTKTNISNETQITISAPDTVGNVTFSNWTGNGCASNSRQQTITVNQDITCNANYVGTTSQTYNLQVNSSGASGVAIEGSSGFSGVTPYNRNVSSGTNITLTAPASSGETNFTGWTGVGCSSSNRTITVNISANRTCTANYARKTEWQLSVSSSGVSSVDITSSPWTYGGKTSYTRSGISHGSQITLTAPSKVGNVSFTGWTGLGCTNSSVSTTVNMTANRNCVANYSTTSTPPPSNNKPTLSCNAVSSNQINLSWSHISGVSLYYVWQCEGSTCTPRTSVGTTSSSSYSVRNLNPNTTYRFRIYGTGSVSTPDSNYVTCTTTSSTTPPPPPSNNKPTLSCNAVSSNQINLSWSHISGVSLYYVWQCEGSTCTPRTSVGTTSSSSYSVRNLNSNTTYRFRIYGTGSVSTPDSNYVTCTTTSSTTPPPSSGRYATPTGLSCSTTANSVNLYWNSVSGASAYYLYSCMGSSCNPIYYSSSGMTTSISRTFTSLLPSTTYNYQVEATGTMLDKSYASTIKSCTTSSGTTPPTDTTPVPNVPNTGYATGTLSVVSTTRNTMTISYNYQNAPQGAVIKLSNYAYLTHLIYSSASGTTIIEGHPSFSGSMLQPGTTYTVELFAKTASGQIGERIASTSGRTLN